MSDRIETQIGIVGKGGGLDLNAVYFDIAQRGLVVLSETDTHITYGTVKEKK